VTRFSHLFPDDQVAERVFSVFDRDGDGLVGVDELVDGFDRFVRGSASDRLVFLFEAWDLDRDGSLSREEAVAMAGKLASKPRQGPRGENAEVEERAAQLICLAMAPEEAVVPCGKFCGFLETAARRSDLLDDLIGCVAPSDGSDEPAGGQQRPTSLAFRARYFVTLFLSLFLTLVFNMAYDWPSVIGPAVVDQVRVSKGSVGQLQAVEQLASIFGNLAGGAVLDRVGVNVMVRLAAPVMLVAVLLMFCGVLAKMYFLLVIGFAVLGVGEFVFGVVDVVNVTTSSPKRASAVDAASRTLNLLPTIIGRLIWPHISLNSAIGALLGLTVLAVPAGLYVASAYDLLIKDITIASGPIPVSESSWAILRYFSALVARAERERTRRRSVAPLSLLEVTNPSPPPARHQPAIPAIPPLVPARPTTTTTTPPPPPPSSPTSDSGHKRNILLTLFRLPALFYVVALLVVAMYIVFFGFSIFSTFVLVDRYGVTVAQAGLLNSIGVYLSLSVGIPAGFMGGIYGHRLKMVAIGTLCWMISMVLLISPNVSPTIIMVFHGFGCVFPRVFLYGFIPLAVRDKSLWGPCYGVLPAFGSLFLGVGGLLLGWGYDRAKDPPVMIGIVMLVWSVLALSVCVALLLLDKRSRLDLPGFGLSSKKTSVHRIFAPFSTEVVEVVKY
jgi:MFS family permease